MQVKGSIVAESMAKYSLLHVSMKKTSKMESKSLAAACGYMGCAEKQGVMDGLMRVTGEAKKHIYKQTANKQTLCWL